MKMTLDSIWQLMGDKSETQRRMMGGSVSDVMIGQAGFLYTFTFTDLLLRLVLMMGR